MLPGTALIHADDDKHNQSAVVPPISVTTTFRLPAPEFLAQYNPLQPQFHIYSRYTQDITTRVEKVISSLCGGRAITFASGLSATYAALVHLKPKRIAIGGGYFGVHNTMAIYNKSTQTEVPLIDLDSDYQPGDLCWLETPLNPTGEARDIEYYANKIHKVGGILIVDATFAPPPLQYPFKWGADIVMYSGTKYFGGHSDLLCGILVVKTEPEWLKLLDIRTYIGNPLGSLEAWLLLRSLKTMHLRVPRQSQTATGLVAWLDKLSKIPSGSQWDGVPGGLLRHVIHPSLDADKPFIPKQLEGGYPATFGIIMQNADLASDLPFKLKYFAAATSLGGVESLIEQRGRADPKVDPCLLRISVGVEDLEDLKDDLRHGFNELLKGKEKARL